MKKLITGMLLVGSLFAVSPVMAATGTCKDTVSKVVYDKYESAYYIITKGNNDGEWSLGVIPSKVENKELTKALNQQLDGKSVLIKYDQNGSDNPEDFILVDWQVQ